MDDEGDGRDDEPCCCFECRSQVFTSVLLGILSCVLVTGGVFLAFHKWDHTWLLVSAVGVILIIIGTILHCCAQEDPPKSKRGSNKGRPHVIPCGGAPGDNGTLTEQLLPLSNARSVSQLSLNMVPSYFPAYSIEQHSAVVQNINRIVQGTGRSFLLLTIPSDASPAQLQNLMASVCQLDGSVSAEESSSSQEPQTTELSSQTTDISQTPSTETLPVQELQAESLPSQFPSSSSEIITPGRIVKHAEVQTCCDWQVPCSSTSSDGVRTQSDLPTTSVIQVLEECREVCVTLPDSTPIDEDATVAGSTEDVSICMEVADVITDNNAPNCSNNTELSEPPSPCNIPIVTNTEGETGNFTGELVDISSPSCVPQVIVATEVLEDSVLDAITIQTTTTEAFQPVMDSLNALQAGTSGLAPSHNIPSELELLGADLSSTSSDPLDSGTEIEDSESIGRSSPPPSYDDVTQENQTTLGVFGLAYGTI